jgi:RimJ/RimL family protein N-acetyltransferase
MKFKGIHIGKSSGVSLGKFYNTDVRKLVALGIDQPWLFDDSIQDKGFYITGATQRQDTLFLALREKKRVIGYGAFFPFVHKVGFLHLWDRKNGENGIKGVVRLLLQFGFNELQIEKMNRLVPVPDKEGNKLMMEMGFILEGTLRESYYFSGEPVDTNVYGMLRRELWHSH